MTRRGRASIAVLVGVAFIGSVWLMKPSGPADADSEPVARDGASAPPLPPSGLREPPRKVFERLPVSRSALALPVFDAQGATLGPVAEVGVRGRLYEMVPIEDREGAPPGPLRVEYTLDAELTRAVFRVLRKGRVVLGHVILLDPANGRVLAYASTDVGRFPPTRAYPAASLVKIITVAAALDRDPVQANLPCRFRGSPYRLTPSRIDPPRSGKTVSLRQALATSNNQCFAQLAIHAVGPRRLLDAISRFGWLDEPAPAHEAGSAEAGEDRYDVGRLGCGLAGCRITPLHAAQLAATLARGELIAPRWIERIVDAEGRELPLPATAAPRQVMSPELAAEIRAMLVDTTRRGTARSAFRKRNGQPLLGPVNVAGKTGSLSGKNPRGRYEWFVGTAPAEDPRVAVAVLLVQSELWWRNASQIAAEVLRGVFCSEGACRKEGAARWVRNPGETMAGVSAAPPLGG